jgi:hypothetical protein
VAVKQPEGNESPSASVGEPSDVVTETGAEDIRRTAFCEAAIAAYWMVSLSDRAEESAVSWVPTQQIEDKGPEMVAERSAWTSEDVGEVEYWTQRSAGTLDSSRTGLATDFCIPGRHSDIVTAIRLGHIATTKELQSEKRLKVRGAKKRKKAQESHPPLEHCEIRTSRKTTQSQRRSSSLEDPGHAAAHCAHEVVFLNLDGGKIAGDVVEDVLEGADIGKLVSSESCGVHKHAMMAVRVIRRLEVIAAFVT